MMSLRVLGGRRRKHPAAFDLFDLFDLFDIRNDDSQAKPGVFDFENNQTCAPPFDVLSAEIKNSGFAWESSFRISNKSNKSNKSNAAGCFRRRPPEDAKRHHTALILFNGTQAKRGGFEFQSKFFIKGDSENAERR